MRTLTIGKNDAGQRLDKFLGKAVKAMPQSLMYKLIRMKKIKVNRKRTEQSYRLCEGDTVEMFVSEEFFAPSAASDAYKTLKPNIEIIFENDELIICDKRPGMIVHSDDGEEINTLIGHIKAYLYQKGEYDPASEQSFAPALCNRIDRNTGGIVIAAKTAEALRRINAEIKNNETTKKYLCAVHGILSKKEDTLTGYIIKDGDENMVTVYKNRPNSPDARNVITKYKVLSEKNELSLLEVELVTGRTHQIRAHMASIGHPLLGDGKYGSNRGDRRLGYKYQALYSYWLELEGNIYTVDKSKIWFLKEFDQNAAAQSGI
ncbi:MAG: RluA family pseudouridine synthase [Eubacteriales bacterium]